jgi:hypothetical protein
MPEQRLPLITPLLCRDNTLDKDGLMTNAYIETSKTGTQYARKRPGFLYGYEGTTTTNLGVWFNNGTTYVIDPDDPSVLIGFVAPDGPASIISTPVELYYEFGGEIYGVVDI